MRSAAESELEAIEERLDARRARAWALGRLAELFRSARVPDPAPDGFLSGRPLALGRSAMVDGIGRRLAELYMPWLGKRFETATSSGVNVFTKSARIPLRLLWPSYVPERELADRIEAFTFVIRRGPSQVEPATEVLKVDYDRDPNPDLLVRRALDEVVELDAGIYLGKALLRAGSGWRELGYFTLRSAGSPAMPS